MPEQVLKLHDLSFVNEGAEVVVGRLSTGSYAVFPADGAELLRRIGEGMPLGQASAWYEGSFGEPVRPRTPTCSGRCAGEAATSVSSRPLSSPPTRWGRSCRSQR